MCRACGQPTRPVTIELCVQQWREIIDALWNENTPNYGQAPPPDDTTIETIDLIEAMIHGVE